MGLLKWILGGDNRRHIKKLRKSVEKINALESRYAAMTDEELRGMTDVFKARLAEGATPDDIMSILQALHEAGALDADLEVI